MITALQNSDLQYFGGTAFAEGCVTVQQAWEKCEDPGWLLMVICAHRPGGLRITTSLTADILARAVSLVNPPLTRELEEIIIAVHGWANNPGPETAMECTRHTSRFEVNYAQDVVAVWDGAHDAAYDAAYDAATDADDFGTVYQSVYAQQYPGVRAAEVAYHIKAAARYLIDLVEAADESNGAAYAILVLEKVLEARLRLVPGIEMGEVRKYVEHIRAVVPICPIKD